MAVRSSIVFHLWAGSAVLSVGACTTVVNTAVYYGVDGGTPVDAGSGGLDAGAVMDAGSVSDAGGDADSGADASSDTDAGAGTDAGVDAGIDASADAGIDAGADGGISWGLPVLIEVMGNQEEVVLSPVQVVIDSIGRAIAVWDRRNVGGSGDSYIRSCRSDPTYDAGAWLWIDTLEALGRTPRIAMNPSGVAFVVYEGKSRRYEPGMGWGSVTAIMGSGLGFQGVTHVDIAPAGEAVAVFRVPDGGGFRVFGALRDGGAWEASPPYIGAGVIDYYDSDDWLSTSRRIAFDPGGNAIAVWKESDAGRAKVFANRRTAAGAWTGAQALPGDATKSSMDAPSLALDVSGNAFVVWRQIDGGTEYIVASRYAGGNWSSPETKIATATAVGSPRVASLPNGDALAVWTEGATTVYGKQYVVASSQWENDASVVMPGTGVDLAFNSAGVGVVLGISSTTLRAARYAPDAGWGPIGAMSWDGGTQGRWPSVAVDGDGGAVALWAAKESYLIWGTAMEVWAVRFR